LSCWAGCLPASLPPGRGLAGRKRLSKWAFLLSCLGLPATGQGIRDLPAALPLPPRSKRLVYPPPGPKSWISSAPRPCCPGEGTDGQPGPGGSRPGAAERLEDLPGNKIFWHKRCGCLMQPAHESLVSLLNIRPGGFKSWAEEELTYGFPIGSPGMPAGVRKGFIPVRIWLTRAAGDPAG